MYDQESSHLGMLLYFCIPLHIPIEGFDVSIILNVAGVISIWRFPYISSLRSPWSDTHPVNLPFECYQTTIAGCLGERGEEEEQ